MIKEQTVLSALRTLSDSLMASHQSNAIKLTHTKHFLLLCFIRQLFVTFCQHLIDLLRIAVWPDTVSTSEDFWIPVLGDSPHKQLVEHKHTKKINNVTETSPSSVFLIHVVRMLVVP